MTIGPFLYYWEHMAVSVLVAVLVLLYFTLMVAAPAIRLDNDTWMNRRIVVGWLVAVAVEIAMLAHSTTWVTPVALGIAVALYPYYFRRVRKSPLSLNRI